MACGSCCCSLISFPVSLSKQLCNAALNARLSMWILSFRFCIGCQVGTQYLTHRPLSIGKACISFLVDWLLCIPINEAIDDTDERRTEERGLHVIFFSEANVEIFHGSRLPAPAPTCRARFPACMSCRP